VSLAPLDDRIAAALERVCAVVDKAVAQAHIERRASLEHARRSLGQRLRWARFKILGPPRWGMSAITPADWQRDLDIYRGLTRGFPVPTTYVVKALDHGYELEAIDRHVPNLLSTRFGTYQTTGPDP